MIPLQHEADLGNPEEHFLWALHCLPTVAGTGAITHPSILRCWSTHLVKAGFAHRDWLEKMADENGNIHVSKLPQQIIKKVPAFRGARHAYNNAAHWVPMDHPEPRPMKLQDPASMTMQERHAMLQRFADLGMIPEPPPVPDSAEVTN